jgi:hypothetical protein
MQLEGRTPTLCVLPDALAMPLLCMQLLDFAIVVEQPAFYGCIHIIFRSPMIYLYITPHIPLANGMSATLKLCYLKNCFLKLAMFPPLHACRTLQTSMATPHF